MLRSLKEVQADDSVVGFYQVTAFGAFYNQTLVDTQAIYQSKLRHGGVVVVHGDFSKPCTLKLWRGAHGVLLLSPKTFHPRPAEMPVSELFD
jgi:hypothetical protein